MAMEIRDLYNFVLLLILIGLLLGAGLLALSKFGATSGITSDASTAINDTITAVKDIATSWLGLLVTIVMIGIIIVVVIRSFGGGGRK